MEVLTMIKHYDDELYKEKMNKIREETKKGYAEAYQAFNDGKISQQELDKAKAQWKIQQREKHRELMEKRRETIEQAGLKYMQKLAGNDDVRSFRESYESMQKMNPEELENHYRTSLKLNDSTALKAAALTAAEKNVKPLVDDFSRRNEKWSETLQSMARFKKRYMNPEARIYEALSDYRSPEEPIVKRETYEAGFFRDNSGAQLPYYRNRYLIK